VLRLDRLGEIEEAAGVYAETKIEELAERKLRFDHPELAQQWDKIQTQRTRITRMKTIALIDTRLEVPGVVPGVSLGILVSIHPDVMAAFAANDAFQKAQASGRHIRTKIVTLKGRLDVGQPVQPAHLAESK
jgi:hypothetical protein